jgi:putative transposase
VEGEFKDGTVTFPKLGSIPAVVHRQPRGTLKTCALVRDGDQWFACISCEFEIDEPAPSTLPAVALDRGVTNLLADSDGTLTPNPRPLQAARKRLARAQRQASRKKEKRAKKNAPRSKNEAKALSRVAKLHRTVRRQREAVLHRLSYRYAKSHGVLIVERLDLCHMTASAKGTPDEPGSHVAQKAGLNRALLDSGLGRFVGMLSYKVVPEGARVVEVPAAYSSQECARCHHVAAENRPTQALFLCVACGHSDHADLNAAKVLYSRGIHGGAVCGGLPIQGPVKQKLRVARRGTRVKAGAIVVPTKAPEFIPG